MKIAAKLAMIGIGCTSSGCTTTSDYSPLHFAPPLINVAKAYDTPTRDNAVSVTDMHITEYEKAQAANANARQAFEVPAIVALIGGVAATAFGGARDGVLVAGTANSAFRSGNAYYAPQSKAAMYSSAVDALYCVRQAAQGAKSIEMFNIFASKNSAEVVIHREVMAGVRQIRSTLTARLSSAGSYTDVASIAADYEKSVKSQVKAEGNAEDAAQRLASNKSRVAGLADGALADLNRQISEEQQKLEDAKASEFQEAIQQCALRARA